MDIRVTDDEQPADSPDPVADEPAPEDLIQRPVGVLRPARQTAPVVFASPHSGRVYPPDFIAASRLDPVSLRRSEDAFVDEIFAGVVELGAPLLRAHFPRAYVDPNREAFELDPAMFTDALPPQANTRSPRVAAGLGTIARVVTSGEEIYAGRLDYADVVRRIATCYEPYHAALRGLIDETRDRFGCCLLVDCHSMPSVGGPMDHDPGRRRVDVVLGDCHGNACHRSVTETAEATLAGMGYNVLRNNPYAGGYTTQHYGRPALGVHAVQVEINRAIYMDERRIERGPGLETLRARMLEFARALMAVAPDAMRAAA